MTTTGGTGDNGGTGGTGGSPRLAPDEADLLLRVAVGSVRAGLVGRGPTGGNPDGGSPDQWPGGLARPGASFVTLERSGVLLGCIGTLEPVRPLAADVASNAFAAAFGDPRFTGITVADFVHMDLTVSVLGPLTPLGVSSLDDLMSRLRPGVDGLLVEVHLAWSGRTYPRHRATFLPSVWRQLRDPAEFVDHLWRKAGMSPGDWPEGIILRRYTTDTYKEAGPREAPSDAGVTPV